MYGGTGAIRSPSPYKAVGAIRGSLSGIEGASVEHSLLVVGRPFRSFVEALLQFVQRARHHVFHLAAPVTAVCLAIYHIPPVAHLEDVGALKHTVPDHTRELSVVFPVAQVLRCIFGELQIACNDHVPQSVVILEHLRVAEVNVGITVVRTAQHPLPVLGPCLEVGRRGTHHHLACGVACIIDVVQSVAFVIHGASSSQGSIQFVLRLSRRENLPQALIVGAVGCRYSIDGMIAPGVVVVKLLQIEHLEVARLLVVERHRVAHPANGRLPVCVVAAFLCWSEAFGCRRPVLCRVASKTVIAASCHSKCSNHYS